MVGNAASLGGLFGSPKVMRLLAHATHRYAEQNPIARMHTYLRSTVWGVGKGRAHDEANQGCKPWSCIQVPKLPNQEDLVTACCRTARHQRGTHFECALPICWPDRSLKRRLMVHAASMSGVCLHFKGIPA